MSVALSFAPVQTTVQFRTSVPSVPAHRPGRVSAWIGVEIIPAIPAPLADPLPYDPAALFEEGDRWDGLS